MTFPLYISHEECCKTRCKLVTCKDDHTSLKSVHAMNLTKQIFNYKAQFTDVTTVHLSSLLK